jgi:leucine dehydrogenase
MANPTKPEPTVSVLAQHVSEHLSVFVVAESTDSKKTSKWWIKAS